MSWENKNLRCSDCKFWWPTGTAGAEPIRRVAIFGRCRRSAPPSMVGDLPDHSPKYPVWATTKRDDWCGEHEHLETL